MPIEPVAEARHAHQTHAEKHRHRSAVGNPLTGPNEAKETFLPTVRRHAARRGTGRATER